MMQINDILQRVGEVIKSDKNKDIAAALAVTTSACSTWKNRGTIPKDALFKFAQDHQISLDWLMSGQGQRSAKSSIPKFESTRLDIPLSIEFMESIKEHEDLKYELKSLLSALEYGKFEHAKRHARELLAEIERVDASQKS
jgi:hypothetical protein